jgi:hypothetical protein
MRSEEVLQKISDEENKKTRSKKVVGHSLTLVLRKIDKVMTTFKHITFLAPFLSVLTLTSTKDIQKITNLIWEGANSSGIITEALLADALLCTGFFKMVWRELECR